MEQDCIFCKIIKGEIPSAKVYEDDKVFAFLDIMPANKGHCLVIPKTHSKNLTDIKDEDSGSLMHAAKKVAKALSLSLGCPGFSLVMNNEKEANQVVFHTHLHIIPRFKDDGKEIRFKHETYAGNEINEFADKIKKFI